MSKQASWVKFEVGMYDHPKLKIIDSMENRDLIHYIWTSSILLAGRSNSNGELYLSANIPYTLKTLAITFRRTDEEVKKAYKVLRTLNMIEFTEDKVFKIRNWEKYQNIDGLEKIRKQTNERVAKYREKKREEKRIGEEQKKAVKEESDSGENSYDEYVTNNSVTCNNKEDVTDSKISVTETQENRKESRVKNKNKKRMNENKDKSVSISEDIYAKAIELSQYCERITGKIGILDNNSLNMAIDIHGSDNVKKAIQKAVEMGKVNMRYICGILMNWKKEGYPKDKDQMENNKNYGGVIGNGTKCNDKSSGADTVQFEKFKPKEPRKLTEEERKEAYRNVI